MSEQIMLPVGPFRAWIEARLLSNEGAMALAAQCGVSRRDMQEWRYEDEHVTFIEVDDALTAEGSTAFWELGVYAYDEKGRQVKVEPTFEMEVYAYVADCGDLDEPAAAEVHGLPAEPTTQLDLDWGMAA